MKKIVIGLFAVVAALAAVFGIRIFVEEKIKCKN